MEEKVTISDIAARTGVSLATVSLVMNNRPGVSQETRQRVLAAAQSLGYQPKGGPALARNGSRMKTVGLLVKTDPAMPPHANPFYSKVILGIEDACRRSGMNLLFSALPVDEDNHLVEIPPLITNEGADGLLLVGAFVDKTITSLRGHKVPPVVLVDAYAIQENYDRVISDNFNAAYQAVEYLIGLGHRHIGLVGGQPDAYPSLRDRRNGYLRALKDTGLEPACMAEFNINNTHGFSECSRMLEANPQLTALFGINDDVALAALRAAQHLGKRVPEDLSVIGYDDIYLAAEAVPPLTTLHVDTVAMGRAAVDLLAFRQANPEAARITLTIHPTLVPRASTAAPYQP